MTQTPISSAWDMTPYSGALDLLDSSGVEAGLAFAGIAVAALAAWEAFDSRGETPDGHRLFGNAAGASFACGFLIYITWTVTIDYDLAHWAASLSSSMLAFYVPLLVLLFVVCLQLARNRSGTSLLAYGILFVAGIAASHLTTVLLIASAGIPLLQWLVGVAAFCVIAAVFPLARFVHGKLVENKPGAATNPAELRSAAKYALVLFVLGGSLIHFVGMALALAPCIYQYEYDTGVEHVPRAKSSYNFMLFVGETTYFDTKGDKRYTYSYERDLLAGTQRRVQEDLSDQTRQVRDKRWKTFEDLRAAITEEDRDEDTVLRTWTSSGLDMGCIRWKTDGGQTMWTEMEYRSFAKVSGVSAKRVYDDSDALQRFYEYDFDESTGNQTRYRKYDNRDVQLEQGNYKWFSPGSYPYYLIDVFDNDGNWLRTEYYDGNSELKNTRYNDGEQT